MCATGLGLRPACIGLRSTRLGLGGGLHALVFAPFLHRVPAVLTALRGCIPAVRAAPRIGAGCPNLLEPLARFRIAEGRVPAMTRIVLPGDRSHVGSHDIPVHSHMGDVIVDHGDMALMPVGTAEEEVGRDHDAGTPEEARPVRVDDVVRRRPPVDRRVRRPPPRPVDDDRVVVRHVDDLGRGLADGDDLALARDAHLLARAEVAGRLGAPAQTLHRVHDVGLLREESLAQPLRPVELLVHHGEDLRERRQRLDAGVPVHALDRPYRVLTLQAGVGARPAGRLHHLQRVGGRHQDLRQQRIGIERYRRQHLVELRLPEGDPVLGERLRERDRCREQQDERPYGHRIQDLIHSSLLLADTYSNASRALPHVTKCKFL